MSPGHQSEREAADQIATGLFVIGIVAIVAALVTGACGCGGAPFEGPAGVEGVAADAAPSTSTDAETLNDATGVVIIVIDREAGAVAETAAPKVDAAPDTNPPIATDAGSDAPVCFVPIAAAAAPDYCSMMGAASIPDHMVRVFHASGQLTCQWSAAPTSCACDYSCGCILPKMGSACEWQCAMNTDGVISVYCKGDGP